jgi:glycine/D-amino acid oxidase-like deaminating enzyme
MATKAELPKKARAVVIGGGIIGCSVVYHLTKIGWSDVVLLGWSDVVLLERQQLTSGTTWHAAGLIGQLRQSINMTNLARYTTDLYSQLEANRSGHRLSPGWVLFPRNTRWPPRRTETQFVDGQGVWPAGRRRHDRRNQGTAATY